MCVWVTVWPTQCVGCMGVWVWRYGGVGVWRCECVCGGVWRCVVHNVFHLINQHTMSLRLMIVCVWVTVWVCVWVCICGCLGGVCVFV